MISCGSPFKSETKQAGTKLHHQAQTNKHAGEIGCQPAWIVNDLQDGAAIVAIEASLVISLSGIAQGIIHVNIHRTLLAGIRPVQEDTTRKVFWGVGTRINLMRKLQ